MTTRDADAVGTQLPQGTGKTSGEGRVRVFLVDDHPIALAGLRAVLSASDAVDVVGEASSGREALDRIHADATDVVLLDILLGDANGIEVAGALKAQHPSLGVLLLSAVGQEYLDAAIDGADGLILKTAPIDELVRAIHNVYKGRPTLDRRLWASLFQGDSA